MIYIAPCYFEDVDAIDATLVHLARVEGIDRLHLARPEAQITVGPLVDFQDIYADNVAET